ncbi:Fmn2 [Symbiodinium sp. KB8]|nr:Fmn2 [Symbiodinium sp. KB8]
MAALACILYAALSFAEIRHDMLVTPTRAQMNDVFDPDTAESRSAVVGGIAKTFAMLCAILLPRAGAFLTVAVVAFFSTTAQLFWRPEKAALAIQDSLAEVQREDAASERVRTYPAGFWQLWLLQCAGWLSVCTWSFYFTSVWAEIKGARSSKNPGFEPAVREATGYLLLGSFVFLGAGGALSRLSNLCTEWASLFASVLVMMLTLMVLCMAHLNSMLHWLAAALVVFGMPVAYQILANTPFKWLESQPGFDETQRGWLTGIFNTTLAVAQAFTAVLSGPIVAAAGGRLWAAYAAAFLFDVLVLVLVMVMRSPGRQITGLGPKALLLLPAAGSEDAIVPVYVFGEAQLFKQSRILMGFRSWVQRTLGVALVMPYGPWGMPWQKYPDPVRIVVGKPLAMPRIPDPSKADVAEHHSKCVEELGKLFERHKAGAGYPDSSLQIAMGQDVGPYADDPKISSGKGKAKGKAPTKSADAGAAKGGKKGAPGGKGKGAPSLSKSPVAPSKAMKPLWWKRLLFGTDLQPGAIWERVRDETQSLPAEELEHRFGKAQAQAPSKPTGPSPTGASEVIRIRTDAVQDRELRLLPSPAECGRALAELEDQRLALDELERLQRAVCPTKRELELLEEARQLQPMARLGRREEYWEQLRLIPSFEQRMECWHFIRTYRERVACQSQHLEDLLDIFQSLEKSEAVPSLLALILATGIWMNRGTEFAAAKGFGIEFLEKLHSIKGADGKSLQHLLFVVFFDSLDSQAAEFVEALGPLLQNVSRRVIQDSEETKISKAVHLSLEECDEAVSSIHETALDIQASLQKCTGGLDPSDPVKLRLHREFATATKMIESLVQLRNSVKSQYDRVLQWFHAPGWRSADFFLLWDNFLLPSELLAARCRDGQSPAPDARHRASRCSAQSQSSGSCLHP